MEWCLGTVQQINICIPYIPHRVQNGSGTHLTSYPVGTRVSFLGGKAAGVLEFVELYLHSPNTPSWRGAQLKQRDNFTFTF